MCDPRAPGGVACGHDRPPAERSYDVGTWAALSRRLSPYLDIAIGLVATVMAVLSLVSTDVATIDPRLEPADPVGGDRHRGRRPVAGLASDPAGGVVRRLHRRQPGGDPDRPLHRPAVGADAVQPLLAGRSRRRGARAGRPGAGIVVFVVLALLDVPDLGPRTCCSRSRCWWPRGRSGTRSGRVAHSRRAPALAEQEAATAREQSAAPSPRSGCGSPASCTTSWRTACR